MNGITSKTKYLGDSSTTDWVMDGQAVIYDNNVLLTMAPDTSGTVLASSTYVWYGNIKATLKTSRGQGVVTAFILLSDVKDEIDYEFVGSELTTAQSNYYFQGITNYDNGGNITLSDTFNNFHTYEIDWTPDTITWLVDGQVGRTKKRSDTWNATSNQWDFPQTPARVQLSIWPGGLASNAPGTISWAGGLIDWNSADIQSNGYDYATFESVTVSCFNATSPPGTNTGVSYTYNNLAGTNDTVVDGNKPTVLKSLLGTGTNMSADYPSSVSASGSAATSSGEATIPGLSGAGPGTDGHSGDSSSSSADSGSAASSTDSGTSPSSTGSSGFSQGSGNSASSSTKSGAEKIASQERVLKGSLFAGIVAAVGMMAL
jgi:beta-glucanase (GH16 family)